jgi:hypothetical protein
MKLSKAALHQIIKEETLTLLEVDTQPMTRYAKRKGPRQQRRDQDRSKVAKFFGSADPLVTKAADPDETLPPTEDPDKTVARSPEEMAARAAEFDRAEPKQATERDLNDPDRLVITAFDSDVRAKLLEDYASQTGIEIDDRPLGHGEFGIVYEGENPEYGPVAVKMTLSGQEINAYKNIKKLKDGLESRDPEVGNVLPTILDIRTITSPPVGPEGQIRAGRYIEKPDGRSYKVFVVQMELLEKLNPDTRVDVFGPDPSKEDYSPEVRKRFVEEYLTIENIYSSLEKLFQEEGWEKLGAAIEEQPIDEGPTGRSIDLQGSGSPSLPVKDARFFPPLREIERVLPRLRKAYLDAPASNQFFALRDIHNILRNTINKAFQKYVDDTQLLNDVGMYAGPLLQKQMAANARLPQYDPEMIKQSKGLRSTILPPSEFQSRVAKNFYNRLKKLEKFDAQYGDVHANNLMQRDNGDLVVADVGLFLFGKEGERGYAGAIVERFQHLAGIILK